MQATSGLFESGVLRDSMGDQHVSEAAQAWPTMVQPPNEVLIHFFDMMVQRDLPHHAGQPPQPRQFEPVVTAIESLTAEQRQQRSDAEARQQAASRGKTPMEFCREFGVTKLMRLCQVHHEANLPPLWAQLAASPKTGRIAAVQNAIDEQRQAHHVCFNVPVTVNLVTKLTQVDFAGHDKDELTQGIAPFLLGITAPEQAEQTACRSSMCQQIHGGDGTPSLVGARVLEALDDAVVATAIQAVQQSFDGLRIVLSAAFGAAHPLVQWLTHVHQSMDVCANDLAAQVVLHPTLPADLQHCAQAKMCHWFQAQTHSQNPVPFRPLPVVAEAAQGTCHWRLDLPTSVLQPPTMPRSQTTGQPQPGPNRANAPGDNSIVRNEQHDERFTVLRERPNVGSRTVKQRCARDNVALPTDSQGAPRCLPHHFIGQCNNNCGSRADHHHNHTEQEQVDLLTWGTQHWKTEWVIGNGSCLGTWNQEPLPAWAHKPMHPQPPQVESRKRCFHPTTRGQDVAASALTDKLGKQIARDAKLLHLRGLSCLLRLHSGRGDWGPLVAMRQHAAHRVLTSCKCRGAPVTVADEPWSNAELQGSIARGPHKSTYEHIEFLREDMSDCVDKGFWVVVPCDNVKNEPNLRLSPVGVVPQHACRPRPIVDHTFCGVNPSAQPNVPMESMQFGHTLDRILRRALLANPNKGRVCLTKIDSADGFHRMQLAPEQAPTLGVVFPRLPGNLPWQPCQLGHPWDGPTHLRHLAQ